MLLLPPTTYKTTTNQDSTAVVFSNSLVRRHCIKETDFVCKWRRIRSRNGIHFVWQHLVLITTRFILFPALQFSPRSPCLTAELSCNSKRFSTLSDTLWIYLPRFPDTFLFMKRNWKEKTALFLTTTTTITTSCDYYYYKIRGEGKKERKKEW